MVALDLDARLGGDVLGHLDKDPLLPPGGLVALSKLPVLSEEPDVLTILQLVPTVLC